jgi:adenylyl cyclase-associated protein
MLASKPARFSHNLITNNSLLFFVIKTFKEKNRQSQLFNHLSTISESIGALGWIAVSPAPAPYVKEMSDSGQFFSNRVLKDYKEK